MFTSSNISSKDNWGFGLAVKVAKLSECRFAHGAAILRGKSIVSLACNKVTTHPIQRRYNAYTCSIHAEVRSIILAKTDVTGCVCYSARVNKAGELLISKPCAICNELIRESGIREVVYYDGSGIIKERYV